MQLTLLSNFASNFQAAVDGRGTSADGIEMNELYGGARIRCMLMEALAPPRLLNRTSSAAVEASLSNVSDADDVNVGLKFERHAGVPS